MIEIPKNIATPNRIQNPFEVNQLGNFKELSAGAGASIFKVNKEGVFLGATNYTSGLIKFGYTGNARFGGATGPSIGITGSSGQISLQYDNASTGTIDGYTTEGSEVSYIRITAVSERSIKLKNSYIEFNGDLKPATDIGYSLGSTALRWNDVYAKTVVTWGTGSKFSCQGSDGITESLQFITALDKQGDDYYKKARTLEFKGGILTSKGTESDWEKIE